MYITHNPVRLLRYLIICNINTTLVKLPNDFVLQLSSILGTLISRRLPTKKAAAWEKTLARAKEIKINNQELSSFWPVEAVLLPYFQKNCFGQGEKLIWELKLFGDAADHGFFLEVILPALEEAGYTSEPLFRRELSLWGHYDLEAVYVAHGNQWVSLIQEGRLDLRYDPGPTQWFDGLPLEAKNTNKVFKRLVWTNPVRLEDQEKSDLESPPGLEDMIVSLIRRMAAITTRKKKSFEKNLTDLIKEDRQNLLTLLDRAGTLDLRGQNGRWVNYPLPGWQGSLTYEHIPREFIPYLQVASILHLGQDTHFGKGTFYLVS